MHSEEVHDPFSWPFTGDEMVRACCMDGLEQKRVQFARRNMWLKMKSNASVHDR